MIDIYLRFVSETAAYEILQPNGESACLNIDYVGLIDGAEGFHVNVRLMASEALPDAARPYRIEAPEFPKRVWA